MRVCMYFCKSIYSPKQTSYVQNRGVLLRMHVQALNFKTVVFGGNSVIEPNIFFLKFNQAC